MRRHDRHHDHRGTISWDASDAVLINDNRLVPGQLGPRLGHCMGESEKLVARHETGGADEEGGDLHVGVAIVRQVIDDGADFRRAQRVTLDFGTHRIKASW